jgi:hypothetical protein
MRRFLEKKSAKFPISQAGSNGEGQVQYGITAAIAPKEDGWREKFEGMCNNDHQGTNLHQIKEKGLKAFYFLQGKNQKLNDNVLFSIF